MPPTNLPPSMLNISNKKLNKLKIINGLKSKIWDIRTQKLETKTKLANHI